MACRSWSLVMMSLILCAGAAAAEANEQLRLEVAIGAGSSPFASCQVAFELDQNGGDILDAASQAGCIESWGSKEFDFGRFVAQINEIPGTNATFWAFLVNGEMSSMGIDDYRAKSQDILRFEYLGIVSTPEGSEALSATSVKKNDVPLGAAVALVPLGVAVVLRSRRSDATTAHVKERDA